ncbi:MAG: hypothetical protein ACRCXX_06170 [Cetobacterium sp.]|uniref:hypothetical protein n=1 Tax=Cetobacterium sp. TaxID=2071632 RepID=UPI003F2E6503
MKFRNLRNKYFFYDVNDGNSGGEGGGTQDIIPPSGEDGNSETLGDTNTPSVDGEGANSEEDFKPFNPLEMTFDESEYEEKPNLDFNGYNLEKYQDKINFNDEAVRERFTNLSKEYQEAGFTQNQIEFMLDKELQMQSQKERITDEQIMKDLKERLSPEVKKNWGTLTKELDVFFENSKFKEHKKAFMGNPVLMNMIYEYGKSIKPGNTDPLKQRDFKGEASRVYTASGAYDEFSKIIKSGNYTDAYALAKELNGKIKESDRAAFKDLMGSYLS